MIGDNEQKQNEPDAELDKNPKSDPFPKGPDNEQVRDYRTPPSDTYKVDDD